VQTFLERRGPLQMDEGHPELLGHRIARLRRAKGWNQGELARRIGTTNQQISKYERGSYLPKLDALARIAEVFDTTVDYLLHGHEPQRKPDPRIRALVAPLERLPAEARAHVASFLEAFLKACEAGERYRREGAKAGAAKIPKRRATFRRRGRER
jgi:transcriptional regulator with XRE-family HTH domain